MGCEEELFSVLWLFFFEKGGRDMWIFLILSVFIFKMRVIKVTSGEDERKSW